MSMTPKAIQDLLDELEANKARGRKLRLERPANAKLARSLKLNIAALLVELGDYSLIQLFWEGWQPAIYNHSPDSFGVENLYVSLGAIDDKPTRKSQDRLDFDRLAYGAV
jgi:hypothetical protein